MPTLTSVRAAAPRRVLRCVSTFATSLTVASVLLAGPARAAPVEVHDALGRTISLPDQPRRVVVNFNFEEFTAVAGVDGWSRVVGISRAPWESWRPAIFSRYKAVIPNLADMPDIGNSDDNTFSVEKVIAPKAGRPAPGRVDLRLPEGGQDAD